MIDISECNGCKTPTPCWELSEDGYCESCEYEDSAKLDYLTDGE